MNEIEKLGFVKNTKVINGFIPHYIKGNLVLFLIGADFWIKKIVTIDKAFEKSNYKVLGILTEKAAPLADKDWVTGAPTLTLIQVNPLKKGQWNNEGNDLEYVPINLTDLSN